MKSILQPDEKVCYITGSQINLDKHHVMSGVGNRKLADKWGVWVWLRHDVHMSLHDRDKDLDYRLRKDAQRAFEEKYGHEQWMSLFRKNYL